MMECGNVAVCYVELYDTCVQLVVHTNQRGIHNIIIPSIERGARLEVRRTVHNNDGLHDERESRPGELGDPPSLRLEHGLDDVQRVDGSGGNRSSDGTGQNEAVEGEHALIGLRVDASEYLSGGCSTESIESNPPCMARPRD